MAKKYGEKVYVGKVMVGKPKLDQNGSEIKKDGKTVRNPDYIVIDQDFELKKGDYLKLESKAQRIADLQASMTAGRLKEEKGLELIEKAKKASDNVRFTIIFQQVTEE